MTAVTHTTKAKGTPAHIEVHLHSGDLELSARRIAELLHASTPETNQRTLSHHQIELEQQPTALTEAAGFDEQASTAP